MYFLDQQRGHSGSLIYRTAAANYPLNRDRSGRYKVQSGEMLRVCMTSDFFLAEADQWRAEAWRVIRQRSDVKFYLLTKRPQRVEQCLPRDWGDGWENVFFNVTCENQQRADERLPLLVSLPMKHRGVMCAPFIGPVSLAPFLATGLIELVMCGGENYDGARPCHFDWVKSLRRECEAAGVTFNFLETGTCFVKDGKTYHLPDKRLQSRMAFRSGMNFVGRPMVFKLEDEYGPVPPERLYRPHYRASCADCSAALTCNGCSNCGKCR